MFGKIFSIIAGLGLINSFYMPWYRFDGIKEISPWEVLNYLLTQPLYANNIFKIATMVGIIVLGALMIITAIFPKLVISIAKLAIALGLAIFHVSYFYQNILISQTPFEWIRILETSPGFLLFCGALILYFLTVVFAVILSPLKGITKLVGI